MVVPNNDKSNSEGHPHTRTVGRRRNRKKMGRQMPLKVNNNNNNNNNSSETDRQPGHGDQDSRFRVGDGQRSPHRNNSSRKWQSRIAPVPNLASKGDNLQPRGNDDGIIRFGFQNVNTIHPPSTQDVPEVISVVRDLGIDIGGFVETNRPWTTQNKEIYDINMRRMFSNQTSSLYASIPAPYGTTFQPGGVLQTINGRAVGRISSSGVDKYGRFAWHTLQGSRDEGILVITAYRVCQTSIEQCGPHTAYMQQYTAMVQDGKTNPKPRQQVLTDILKLIREKRDEGLRIILMMDANGSTFNDEKFRTFQQEAILEDPYYAKFSEMPATYMRGPNRLDYILMDEGLLSAVRDIGYLGTHRAVNSDHAMAWVDLDERELFTGRINRPPLYVHRQFTLNQEDKVREFMQEVRNLMTEHTIQRKVVALLGVFQANGATEDVIEEYNSLDKEFTDNIRAALKKTGRRRYGYSRSPLLTEAGQRVNLHKGILDCRRRNAPLSEGVLHLATSLEYDVSSVADTRTIDLRRNVTTARAHLREIQKAAAEKRLDWLQERAELPPPKDTDTTDSEKENKKGNDNETETTEEEWKKKMNTMIETTRAAATNRKLTALTKGRSMGLDRIEIPRDEWMYDEKKHELYHYVKGVFETHAVIQRTALTNIHRRVFYAHHSLKVPDKDSFPVRVEQRNDGTKRIIEVLSREPFRWQSVVSQSEIERHILQRNKRHLQQVSFEGGPSTTHPIRQVTDIDDIDIDEVISDEFTLRDPETDDPLEISESLAMWLRHIRRTPTERAMPPTVGSIPPEALQKAFQMAKEKTASHGDLHYTVWKAMIADDEMVSWMAIMISLPFIYGFAPERWKSMTDVMIEKKKGNRQINQLRIIGLLEADFNTALKYFAREFSRKMEESGELSDEQWGSRNNRNAIDAAMIKLLTWETARVKRSTIGMIYYDLTACFDRMDPTLSNIELRKRNFQHGILQARTEALRYMKRHVRTGLGVSESPYYEEEGDLPLHGEVQGKADNPALYTALSSTMLKTHAALAPGLELKSCNRQRTLERNNVSYVDDNDGHVSAAFDSERPLDELIEKMKLSANIWNEVVSFTGQSIAYHKTAWQALGWQTVRGELKPVFAVNDMIMLRDHKGATSLLKFLPPDQPNKGLGYHLCPDGNQAKEFEVVMAKLQRISAATTAAFLTPREAKQLLYQRLMPALDYVLTLSSFTDAQCKQMDTKIRGQFFPSLGFNRNSADVVMRGPMDQGGMELPEMKSRQTELQTEYVIKQLRDGGGVAKGFLIALDNLQLQSGLITPLYEDATQLPYMDNGLILSLRNRLNEIDATIWIEDAWTPSLQRQQDQSLMEAFVRMGYKPARLRHLNAVRLYMRVITLADLTDPNGKYIAPERLDGTFRAQSELEWHHTAEPLPKWVEEFRKSVRETFCKSMGRKFSYKKPLRLDVPLGKWLPVPRHTLFYSYRGKNSVYRRIFHDDDTTTLQRLTARSDLRGCYRFEQEIDTLPLETFPIQATVVGDDEVWTHRPFDMVALAEPERKPPGYIAEDKRKPDAEMHPVMTVSDSSVHLAEKVASAAWIIPTNPGMKDEYVKACYLMTNMESTNSYRGELEGAYRALYHMDHLGMQPGQKARKVLTQWFDNQSGVRQLNKQPVTGKDKMQPEADLLMAYHHLKGKIQCEVRSKHVKGHQDTRPNKATQQQSDEDSESASSAPTERANDRENDEKKLRYEAELNIECDKLAGEVTENAMNHPAELPSPDDILQMPYEGSKAVLRIGDKWVTAKMKRTLYNARQGPGLRAYIKSRHQWSDEQYDGVNWHTIGVVRRRSDLGKQRFTCKLMHGLLPVNHVRRHVTGISQCPGCPCGDETIAHIFQCPNPTMVTKREEIIAALRKKGLRKLSRKILHTVADIIEQYAAGEEIRPTATRHPAVLAAVRAQGALGNWDDFFRGYLVKEWKVALKETHTNDADQQFDQFQQMIWFDIAWPQWMERNLVANGRGSNADQVESELLTRQLVWYHKHRDELLPIHQRPLARKKLHEVLRMRPATRRAWLHHLEKATQAWERNKYVTASGQRTLLDYFTGSAPPKPPPRNIAREAREQADRGVLRLVHDQVRIDNVLNPVE